MLTDNYKKALRLHTLSISDNVEQAERLAKNYEEYFNSLDKYSQLSTSLVIEHSGWEDAYNESFTNV